MLILDLLERSRSSAEFGEALRQFLRDGRPNDRVDFGGAPPVKVERTLTRLLEAYPELPIDAVEVDARSGCEFFRGTATVRAANERRRVAFHWDCKWRAQQEGWTDWFGFPDQARAAREFGHDCFREWEEISVTEAAPLEAAALD
jgi:hypothetical protein